MADFAAWFRREDYERIREVMEDSDRLPPSFDEWELLAKSRVAKEAQKSDRECELRVVIACPNMRVDRAYEEQHESDRGGHAERAK